MSDLISKDSVSLRLGVVPEKEPLMKLPITAPKKKRGRWLEIEDGLSIWVKGPKVVDIEATSRPLLKRSKKIQASGHSLKATLKCSSNTTEDLRSSCHIMSPYVTDQWKFSSIGDLQEQEKLVERSKKIQEHIFGVDPKMEPAMQWATLDKAVRSLMSFIVGSRMTSCSACAIDILLWLTQWEELNAGWQEKLFSPPMKIQDSGGRTLDATKMLSSVVSPKLSISPEPTGRLYLENLEEERRNPHPYGSEFLKARFGPPFQTHVRPACGDETCLDDMVNEELAELNGDRAVVSRDEYDANLKAFEDKFGKVATDDERSAVWEVGKLPNDDGYEKLAAERNAGDEMTQSWAFNE